MKKMWCYICDKCRKVLDKRTMVVAKGKKRELHFCKEHYKK